LQRELKIIISGGGTGGHIFPALAIANAIKKIKPGTEFLFVGAVGKMEMEKVPLAGYKIEGLWISGLQRSLKVSNLMFPVKLIVSLLKSLKIIKKFNPDVAIGVGGYASGPMLYAAAMNKIPALIQEQNSFPGITNRILAKKVKKICVAYENMNKYFPDSKIVLTGNPVRDDVVMIDGKKKDGIKYFGISDSKRVMLVVGGSQGARSINIAVKNGLSKIIENNFQVIWQCGKLFYETANDSVANTDVGNVKVHAFIDRMDYAYAVADVIVTRAGASTVSELCIVGKPAIMVPLPTAAEDHQTRNCMELVNKNAALLVKDADANEKLIDEVVQLMDDDDKRKILSENITRLALKGSADKIANEVFNLVN
jgi:UDP-N-acetylglucosamine--N-acetylmuramyl-(pentapeptide) pyrophosphoryl-undecaprenol N-acetylglucosamine transferase